MRLIDADAHVEHLSKRLMKEVFPDYDAIPFDEKLKIGRLAMEYKKELLAAPTIEAEPVVRCKDCKYWERDWDPTGVNDGRHFCPMIDNNPGPDGFCYLGEKMDLEG